MGFFSHFSISFSVSAETILSCRVKAKVKTPNLDSQAAPRRDPGEKESPRVSGAEVRHPGYLSSPAGEGGTWGQEISSTPMNCPDRKSVV